MNFVYNRKIYPIFGPSSQEECIGSVCIGECMHWGVCALGSVKIGERVDQKCQSVWMAVCIFGMCALGSV